MRGIHQPYELAMYSRKVNGYEVLSLEEERGLAWRYLMGSAEAGQAIIDSNLRLVLKISRAYFHHDRNPLDIIHAGNNGLIRALETFDPGNGIRFSNHAAWWVHKYMRDYVYTDTRRASGRGDKSFFPIPRKVKAIMERGVSWISFLVMPKARKKNLLPSMAASRQSVSPVKGAGRLTLVKNASRPGRINGIS
jgi:RNA polymerase sigma factor (sigma-70 family)